MAGIGSSGSAVLTHSDGMPGARVAFSDNSIATAVLLRLTDYESLLKFRCTSKYILQLVRESTLDEQSASLPQIESPEELCAFTSVFPRCQHVIVNVNEDFLLAHIAELGTMRKFSVVIDETVDLPLEEILRRFNDKACKVEIRTGKMTPNCFRYLKTCQEFGIHGFVQAFRPWDDRVSALKALSRLHLSGAPASDLTHGDLAPIAAQLETFDLICDSPTSGITDLSQFSSLSRLSLRFVDGVTITGLRACSGSLVSLTLRGCDLRDTDEEYPLSIFRKLSKLTLESCRLGSRALFSDLPPSLVHILTSNCGYTQGLELRPSDLHLFQHVEDLSLDPEPHCEHLMDTVTAEHLTMLTSIRTLNVHLWAMDSVEGLPTSLTALKCGNGQFSYGDLVQHLPASVQALTLCLYDESEHVRSQDIVNLVLFKRNLTNIMISDDREKIIAVVSALYDALCFDGSGCTLTVNSTVISKYVIDDQQLNFLIGHGGRVQISISNRTVV